MSNLAKDYLRRLAALPKWKQLLKLRALLFLGRTNGHRRKRWSRFIYSGNTSGGSKLAESCFTRFCLFCPGSLSEGRRDALVPEPN